MCDAGDGHSSSSSHVARRRPFAAPRTSRCEAVPLAVVDVVVVARIQVHSPMGQRRRWRQRRLRQRTSKRMTCIYEEHRFFLVFISKYQSICETSLRYFHVDRFEQISTCAVRVELICIVQSVNLFLRRRKKDRFVMAHTHTDRPSH